MTARLRNPITELQAELAERRKTEEELRGSEERNRSIPQNAMDGFWGVGLEGHVLEGNQAYCRMSGYAEAELLAKSVSDLEAIEDLTEVLGLVQKVQPVGTDCFESRHIRKGGPTRSASSRAGWRAAGSPFGLFSRAIFISLEQSCFGKANNLGRTPCALDNSS